MNLAAIAAALWLLFTAAGCGKHQRPWLYFPPDVKQVPHPQLAALVDATEESLNGKDMRVYVLAPTGSMEPSLKGGDYCVAEVAPFESLKVGDIVNYRPEWNNRRLTIHRLAAKDKGGWILSGDNNKHSEVFERLTPDKYDSKALRFYRQKPQ